MTSSDPLRRKLDEEMSYHRADCCGESDEPCDGTRMVDALRAVLDLLDGPEHRFHYHRCRDCGLLSGVREAIANALGLTDDQ